MFVFPRKGRCFSGVFIVYCRLDFLIRKLLKNVFFWGKSSVRGYMIFRFFTFCRRKNIDIRTQLVYDALRDGVKHKTESNSRQDAKSRTWERLGAL